MKKISILGSTGSIGKNSLNVVDALSEKFEVSYLTAGSNSTELIRQARKYRPKSIAIADEKQYKIVKEELTDLNIEVLTGRKGILEISQKSDVDMVMNAIVGAPGLEPTYYAIKAGADIALSNKESLVMAGEIIMKMLPEYGVKLFPVDSEHSAIWQCLAGEKPESINKLILTGSGGPFRTWNYNKFSIIKPEHALKHPTWEMGKKITIDSATMMNKGLEVIEARWLFDIKGENIEVIIHPQSIIHSMVEFSDGSIKAQLGLPDMRLPIQYAMNYPDRMKISWENTDFAKIGQLTFEEPDYQKFPNLKLAYDVLKLGGTAPAILNVINEMAVYLFLDNRIKFTDISLYVEKGLEKLKIIDNPKLEDILEVEKIAHDFVMKTLNK